MDFLRSFNASYKEPHDVLGNRLTISFLNGLMYAVPLYIPYYQLKLLNRIDIKLKGKDKSLYKDSYQDLFSYNENIFI